MHDNDPVKCPSCGRLTKHAGWKTSPGTTIEDWDHYECAFHECGRCKVWWIDKLDGSPKTPVPIGGVGKKKQK